MADVPPTLSQGHDEGIVVLVDTLTWQVLTRVERESARLALPNTAHKQTMGGV
jgi:hypothetical protein